MLSFLFLWGRIDVSFVSHGWCSRWPMDSSEDLVVDGFEGLGRWRRIVGCEVD